MKIKNEHADEQLKQVMKVCGGNECLGARRCPFDTDGDPYDSCMARLINAALDLINRQEKEIDRLKKYDTDMAFKHYKDGVKEFAIRLKNSLTEYPDRDFKEPVTKKQIDDLVKELTGEQ